MIAFYGKLTTLIRRSNFISRRLFSDIAVLESINKDKFQKNGLRKDYCLAKPVGKVILDFNSINVFFYFFYLPCALKFELVCTSNEQLILG